MEKELEKKRNKKMDELKSIFTYKTEEQHKSHFNIIMKEIAEYDSQFKYWNSRSKEENEIYPKYYETNIDLEIPGIQHGYLLIGSSYVGEILEDAVFEIIDITGKIYGVSDELARELCEKLQEQCLGEKTPNNQEILSYIDKVDEFMQQKYAESKRTVLIANQKKLDNWLQLRKEEYLLRVKDTSELDELKDKYVNESDFRQKIALKKQIEILEEQKQKMVRAFHKDTVLQIIEQLELDDKELSEIHMLMYLYSYEWGSSLIDKDEFLNSIRLRSDIARNIFYSELPEVIISHSGRITKGLLDALFAVGYDKDSIITIWRNAFDIMKLRFPNLEHYPIDNVLEETDELLGLRNCLLMRFIDGGKESFLATYAYLANAAEEENYSEFTEAIVFCLEHYEQYNLVTQIAIADLVRCYGYRLKDLNVDRMINAINAVYPTGNLLLDVIFSEFTIYKSYLLKCADKHLPDYLEQEDIDFYLAEQLYDLGKEEAREGTDEYAKNSVYRDPIMQVVDTCGIDYVELYERLHASSRLNNKICAFVGGGSKMPETNTVYKSYVIQYALHAIIEKAYRDRKPELIPQNLFRLIPDYQGMYRLFKCHEMQPQNHLYDKNNSCEPFIINNKAEYILVGSFEIRKQIDYHQVSWVYAYQGIVGEDDEENQIPFQQCLVSSIENGECCVISSNMGALIEFRRTLDLELEDEGYLWPGMTVSKLLNVHIEFDFLNGRYIAVNQDNDIVFIMKNSIDFSVSFYNYHEPSIYPCL